MACLEKLRELVFKKKRFLKSELKNGKNQKKDRTGK